MVQKNGKLRFSWRSRSPGRDATELESLGNKSGGAGCLADDRRSRGSLALAA